MKNLDFFFKLLMLSKQWNTSFIPVHTSQAVLITYVCTYVCIHFVIGSIFSWALTSSNYFI